VVVLHHFSTKAIIRKLVDVSGAQITLQACSADTIQMYLDDTAEHHLLILIQDVVCHVRYSNGYTLMVCLQRASGYDDVTTDDHTDFINQLKIPNYISTVSLGLGCFMFLTYVCLPKKSTGRHYLSIGLLISITFIAVRNGCDQITSLE
jgi:hypothetical protein